MVMTNIAIDGWWMAKTRSRSSPEVLAGILFVGREFFPVAGLDDEEAG